MGILQERIPCPPPGNLPYPRIEPWSPTLQADSSPTEPPGKPKNIGVGNRSLLFLTQESNQDILHCRWILYQLNYNWNVIFIIYTWQYFPFTHLYIILVGDLLYIFIWRWTHDIFLYYFLITSHLCCCQMKFRAIFSSVQLLSCVRLFVTPWTAAHQASLSISNSRSLLKLMSIE